MSPTVDPDRARAAALAEVLERGGRDQAAAAQERATQHAAGVAALTTTLQGAATSAAIPDDGTPERSGKTRYERLVALASSLRAEADALGERIRQQETSHAMSVSRADDRGRSSYPVNPGLEALRGRWGEILDRPARYEDRHQAGGFRESVLVEPARSGLLTQVGWLCRRSDIVQEHVAARRPALQAALAELPGSDPHNRWGLALESQVQHRRDVDRELDRLDALVRAADQAPPRAWEELDEELAAEFGAWG